MPWTDKIYSSGYDDHSLRGWEAPRPWDILEVVREHCPRTCSLLDIGCGTARKILPLAAELDEVWGVEPSEEMRTDARRAADGMAATNFKVVDGRADCLPFPDERFHVVTSLLAPHDTRELWRVLRPGGTAIVEKVGESDKSNIKTLFGSDHDGPRGQFMAPEGERQEELRRDLAAVFEHVVVRSGKWRTVLSFEGLIKLLYETNTIRNFDLAADASTLRRIEQELYSSEGIETVQHRLLLIARKAL
jgi:SAM-dependent methyltransferase